MRPTAIIRNILELELIQQTIACQLRSLKKALNDSQVTILRQEETAMDIHVEYRNNGHLYKAIFLRPMLDASVRGKLRNLNGEVDDR